MTTRSRRANATDGWSSACVPTTTWAWPVARASVVERRAAPLSDPVSSTTAAPVSASISDTVRASWRASRSVGARRAPWPPGPRDDPEGVRGHGRLARPDVALDEPQHRGVGLEVAADVGHRTDLVVGEVDRPAEPAREPAADRLAQDDLVLVRDRHRVRALVMALPSARDHAQLERQELVVRQPLERRVPLAERRREVCGLDRLAGRGSVPADLGGQVLRIRPEAVERRAHRGPQLARRDPARQPVDRHDPPGVEELAAVVGLELGVLEDDLPAALAHLAAGDDGGALGEPTLDEAAPEPDRLDLVAGVVAQDRDRALHPTPERLLDAQRRDLGSDGRGRAVVQPSQRGDRHGSRAGRRSGAAGT